jgi:hypothetical protein
VDLLGIVAPWKRPNRERAARETAWIRRPEQRRPLGLAWSRLPVTGDIPSEQAMSAVLLPGGVLLSDATTTWFGEAVTK